MFDDVINTIEQAKELPAVKRVYQNEFVRSKIKQFERFLGRIIRRNVKKAVAPTRKKLTLLNWLLINGVVIAYFVGKADAQNIQYIDYIYSNYTVIGILSILTNASAFILLGAGKILRIASRIILHVFAFLLATFIIYWIIKQIWEFFTQGSKSQDEIPPIQ
ncbi:MAG: hypothetical protein AAFX87_05590 [Bacteroidota bacterium]